MTNKQIIDAFKLARKYGLKTQSFNMLGIPGETIKNIYESIEINRKIQPDRIMCTIFTALKGTEMGEDCFKKGIVKYDPKKSINHYNLISIKYDTINPKTILGYQGFFDWYVRLPKRYYPLIHFLRIIYQTLLTPNIPKNRFMIFFRTILIELAYQSKRILPVSNKYQVVEI